MGRRSEWGATHLLLDGHVGEVHEEVLHGVLLAGVAHSREAAEAPTVHVHLEGAVAQHERVDA